MGFPRKNDFKSNKLSNANSLLKDISLFSKTVGPQYGGSSLGPHQKKSTKKYTTYYLARHSISEYFACEVLLALGINTPKIRIIGLHNDEKNFLIASEAIENYIPLQVLRPDTHTTLPPELRLLRDTYELDIEKQLVINKIDGTIYKISGHLFSLDLAALLISDSDLQPKGNNLGLVKDGNRFYVVTIDKDRTAFKESNYYQLQSALDEEVSEDKLFKAKTSEQFLFLIYAMSQCLIIDKKNKCTFDKIFSYHRVLNTPHLKEVSASYCQNIKKSATSIINYFQNNLGSTILSAFAEREELRSLLADNVVQQLELNGMIFDPITIKNALLEDLRAPYYSSLYHEPLITIHDIDDNQKLLQRLISDMTNELNQQSAYTLETPALPEFEEISESSVNYSFYT